MTAREELVEVILGRWKSDSLQREAWPTEPSSNSDRWFIQILLDALTPDLWLRYGLEMGWLEDSEANPGMYSNALLLLIEEVRRLKQGIWNMAGVTGADQDGQKTPGALAYPDIVTYGLKAVTDLRESYDEALKE